MQRQEVAVSSAESHLTSGLYAAETQFKRRQQLIPSGLDGLGSYPFQ
jgi:hypothetical protein